MPRILVGLENSDVHIRREHNVTTARDVDFHFITVTVSTFYLDQASDPKPLGAI